MDCIKELQSLGIEKCAECHCAVGEDWQYKDFSSKTSAVCPQCKTIIPLIGKVKPIEAVDVIASGYEFHCPHCMLLIKIIESTETVQCPTCTRTYLNNGLEHALAETSAKNKIMETCKNCQREIPETAVACIYCGYIDIPDELVQMEIITESEDIMQNLKFTCPSCGDHKLECCENGPYSSEILDINEDGDFNYGEINVSGAVERYQCFYCGYAPKDKDGEFINDSDGVVEWIKTKQ